MTAGAARLPRIRWRSQAARRPEWGRPVRRRPVSPCPRICACVITRASEPQEGIEVAWATTQGGSLDPTTSVTGADGIATTTWTLGPTARRPVRHGDGGRCGGLPGDLHRHGRTDEPPPPPPADATIQVLGPPVAAAASAPPMSPSRPAKRSSGYGPWVPSGHNVVPDDPEPTSSGSLSSGPKTYRYTFNTRRHLQLLLRRARWPRRSRHVGHRDRRALAQPTPASPQLSKAADRHVGGLASRPICARLGMRTAPNHGRRFACARAQSVCSSSGRWSGSVGVRRR